MNNQKNQANYHETDPLHYWDYRWQNNETGWDIGAASPPIVEYMDQYPDKNARILIPGCGNAYEAEWLLANDFKNITLIDIAPKAVENLKEKFRNQPQIKILCADFFQHEGLYDLIIEQTFFCAIPRSRRLEYAAKTAALLSTQGKVIGLLFDKDFHQNHPPFGGNPIEYRKIFAPHFQIKTMEPSKNSIAPRAGSEVFFILKKNNEAATKIMDTKIMDSYARIALSDRHLSTSTRPEHWRMDLCNSWCALCHDAFIQHRLWHYFAVR